MPGQLTTVAFLFCSFYTQEEHGAQFQDVHAWPTSSNSLLGHGDLVVNLDVTISSLLLEIKLNLSPEAPMIKHG